jgi:hypothetical protein
MASHPTLLLAIELDVNVGRMEEKAILTILSWNRLGFLRIPRFRAIWPSNDSFILLNIDPDMR